MRILSKIVLNKPVPLHTFLFALYPVLSLWAGNLGEIRTTDPLRAIFVHLLLALVLLAPLGLVSSNMQKVGLTVSILIVFWSSYGHIYHGLKELIPAAATVVRHRFLLPAGLLLIAVSVVCTWKCITDPAPLTRTLNLIASVMVLLPLFTITTYFVETRRATAVVERAAFQRGESDDHQDRPDIYYIVLDGYGRADVLNDLYQYDNSWFLSELEARDFFIAGQSRSNYNQTRLSLASSLNLDYLQTLAGGKPGNRLSDQVLSQMIKQSEVRRVLASEGYRLIAFPTTYGPTDIWDADIYVDFYEMEAPISDQEVILTGWNLNRFESLLASTTVLKAFIDLQALGANRIRDQLVDRQYEIHRNVILHTLTGMGDFATREGDYFVFAHAIAPHPPFVFGPNGEQLSPSGAFSFADANYYGGTRQSYLNGYRDQIEYINKLVLSEIDEILAKSDPTPIIIVQGDHGPGAYMNWDSIEETELAERMSILNAYLLPGHNDESLYPSITPINSFRVILNLYFEADYELLQDRSYYSSWDHPFRLVDVTENIDSQR